ncbi:MAG TPA: glycoside hydrolase family 88 protein [Verrucomicrobiae bacterium]|jgi:rhamnogalacturonyl hydrolase YesR
MSNLCRQLCTVLFAIVVVVFQTSAQTNTLAPISQSPVTQSSQASVLKVMQLVADWQLANPVTNRPTGWICGVGDIGMMAMAGISPDPKYRNAMFAKGETNEWQLPQYRGRKYHADDQCIGQVWTELYFTYRQKDMIAPMREKMDFIMSNPAPNQSLDSPNQDTWSWCDALFMAPPSWMRLYAATGDARYMDYAVSNFWRTANFLYDTNAALFYRDSSAFDKHEQNGSKIFWSRGNGWVLAGTARILQYLPTNSPDRQRFEKLFKDMARSVLASQQPDGLWHSSLLDPKDYATPEASGSALFTYGLAWGVNQGLLDSATFKPAIMKSWTALVSCVSSEGQLTHIQPAGSGPVQFPADSTAPYGNGALLLAGSEVYRMTTPHEVKSVAARN